MSLVGNTECKLIDDEENIPGRVALVDGRGRAQQMDHAREGGREEGSSASVPTSAKTIPQN